MANATKLFTSFASEGRLETNIKGVEATKLTMVKSFQESYLSFL